MSYMQRSLTGFKFSKLQQVICFIFLRDFVLLNGRCGSWLQVSPKEGGKMRLSCCFLESFKFDTDIDLLNLSLKGKTVINT